MFVIIIIVYNNDWRVKNVWNTEQLMMNKALIQHELILQIGDEKIEKGTLSDLITATQSVPRVSKIINYYYNWINNGVTFIVVFIQVCQF